MADVQVQAASDVEQAPDKQYSDDANHPLRADGHPYPHDPTNDVTAEQLIVLSFRNLQLKRIGALQDKLIILSLEGQPLPPDHSDRVDQALRAYAQALRDYETLSMNIVPTIPTGARLVGSTGIASEECRITFRDKLVKIVLSILPGLQAFSSAPAPFRTHEIQVLGGLLEHSFRLLSQQDSSNIGSPSVVINFMKGSCGEKGFREVDQEGRVRREERQDLTQRIVMGVFGGIALICPVLVMVLYPSPNTNLITVSVATILFALILAIGAWDSTGKDVLAATAAYTAVLVVFFGTSGS